MIITSSAALCSIIFLFSVNYAFNSILQPHQQQRIRVTLGIEEDLLGAGYNVNQAKIAIGSGGIAGKGHLNGTQTKLKYVPEQHTDFIFCTIGEEQGFIGTTALILAFLILILRVIRIAERQPSAFGRLLRGILPDFPSCHKYRNGNRLMSGNRHTPSIFQLWRIVTMEFHHPSVYTPPNRRVEAAASIISVTRTKRTAFLIFVPQIDPI